MSSGSRSFVKMLGIRVILLDESITIIQAQRQAVGRIVFNEIIKQLNVLESDYFGLEYSDGTTTYWLDLDKKLSRQVGFNLNEPTLKFSVKFYPPDPSLLEEEFTRYLLGLQIKQDLINGELICNDNTSALLISYLVQAECGDWNEDDYPTPSYLRAYKFVANQDADMEERIRDNHRKHVGQTPTDADLHLLETARRTEFYGLKFTHVKDESGLLPNLRITSSCNGILVYQANVKLSHYSWSKIRKISFKRKKFLIKLYKDSFFSTESGGSVMSSSSESVIEYIFPNRNSCKSFWKKCIEVYSFFKLSVNEEREKSRSRSLLSSRGSSFRYTGRTQREMISFLRDNFMKRSNGATPHKRTEPSDKSFGRSASLRSASASHHHLDLGQSATIPHPSVSASYSSPGAMEKMGQSGDRIFNQSGERVLGQSGERIFNQSEEEEEEEEGTNEDNETLSPVGTLSPVPLSPERRADPDWFFYLLRELLHMTYNLETLLKNSKNFTPSNSPPNISNYKNFQNSTLISPLLKILQGHLEGIPKQNWEISNGLTALRLIFKHFSNNLTKYEEEIGKLEISRDFKNKEEENSVEKDAKDFCNNNQKEGDEATINRDLDDSSALMSNFESNYHKLSFLTYVTYLPTQFCTELVSNSQFFPSTPLPLKNLSTELSKLLHSLGDKSIVKLSKLENEMRIEEIKGEFSGLDELDLGSFIKVGILLKFNRKLGLENRIFILSSNYLLYGSRVSSCVGFRLHGLLPLTTLEVEFNGQLELPNSFSLSSNGKILLLSAFNEKIKEGWMLDLSSAINKAKVSSLKRLKNANNEQLDLNLNAQIINNVNNANNEGEVKIGSSYRLNNILHVSWHRNLTLSFHQIKHISKFTISGYLLRKFKNSSGWQKLFVSFNHVCLFFYKSHEDTNPLATLPLLGYKVGLPSEEDGINKELVFKITFKNHIYFFRSESPYTFKRWIYTLSQSTNCIQ